MDDDGQIGLLAEEVAAAGEWRTRLQAVGVTVEGWSQWAVANGILRVAASSRRSQVDCCWRFYHFPLHLVPAGSQDFVFGSKIKEEMWASLGPD